MLEVTRNFVGQKSINARGYSDEMLKNSARVYIYSILSQRMGPAERVCAKITRHPVAHGLPDLALPARQIHLYGTGSARASRLPPHLYLNRSLDSILNKKEYLIPHTLPLNVIVHYERLALRPCDAFQHSSM
jgi:hypothetical protein